MSLSADNRAFIFIVEELYCEGNGRPSVVLVVLFKIVLSQHIYGISSLRQPLKEASMNLTYHWFRCMCTMNTLIGDLLGVPYTALFHHKPRCLPGIQEPGLSLQELFRQRDVHRRCQV